MTVLAVNKQNGAVNLHDLLMSAGPLNDAASKELSSPPTIVASSNFKSNLLDQWSVLKPNKVHTIYSFFILTLHGSLAAHLLSPYLGNVTAVGVTGLPSPTGGCGGFMMFTCCAALIVIY